ncbi:T9SS type A sorting domain-containing protein [Pseudotamlana agarivorans]|uniref:T9SS type A sorting domain-containing protein n=1 Tax=Pseudotamlana agarivorans TaxID=481183 RepID=UPI000832F74E|nr:T9SS type A sorting domain-containing protein [Tamlana agarivorans]
MKRITFFMMMLLSVTVFAQIEIVENFDSTANNQVPTGWTVTGATGATSTFACGATGSTLSTLFSTEGTSESILTTDYANISNGTDLTVSFSYKMYQASFYRTYSAPAAGWGSLILEYSIDSGATWTTITTIDDSNYSYVDPATCTDSADFLITGIPSGSNFQVRFTATASVITSNFLRMDIDNLAFTQLATEIPNCDATLISPVNGSTDADLDALLTWNRATGLPTGYNLTIGTTSGASDILDTTTTDTFYSLASLNLAYSTEYFINIVPTNGIGNATGCVEESFTTRAEPLDGSTCSKPIVISNFPYLGQGDTENFENNIGASPCNTGYMRGNDVFYEISPATDMSINIGLTDVDDNGAGIHVVEGCIDAATECVAYVGASAFDAERQLNEVVLKGGKTYYIVLSSSSASRTYAYKLFIDQNSCISPTIGSLTPVADCANGQFYVDVDVSYLGDASSLTLSDDVASTADITNISSTGVVTVGPYASGTTVNFTLISNDDSGCSYTDSTFFYCPPSNDECANAMPITVNTDQSCTSFVSASNAGATAAANEEGACSTSGNSVWFSFVATNEIQILEYLNVVSAPGYDQGGELQATELFEGSCGSLTSLMCSTGSYVTLTGLTVGNTYYIKNKTNLSGNYAQNYDICIKEPFAAPANDECSNAVALSLSTNDLCDNKVAGTTIGATKSADALDCGGGSTVYNDVWYSFTPATKGVYEFSYNVLNGSTSDSYVVYSGTCGAFTQKSTACNQDFNQTHAMRAGVTYYIVVRSASSGEGIDFELCVFQLPDDAVSNDDCTTATTLVESSDANGNNKIVGNMDNAYPSQEAACSTNYKHIWYAFTPTYTGDYHVDFTKTSGSTTYYTIYNTGDCAAVSEDYVTGISSCSNTVDKTITVEAGKTYLVSLFCGATSASEFELFIYPDATLSTDAIEFENFKYFPNPVVNTLTVQAKNSISNISIINIVGQEVKRFAPNTIKSTVDMNDLNNGIYFVKVSIGTAVKTFKVIKE